MIRKEIAVAQEMFDLLQGCGMFQGRNFGCNFGLGYIPFGRLVRQTKHCKRSDPKDRVQALLSMPDEDEKNISIKPDYLLLARCTTGRKKCQHGHQIGLLEI